MHDLEVVTVHALKRLRIHELFKKKRKYGHEQLSSMLELVKSSPTEKMLGQFWR